MPRYTVLLPTYNERRNLPIITWALQDMFTKNNLDWEIIIIDDGSPDGTQTIAKQLIKAYGASHIKLHTRTGKLGLGTAYVHGLQFATGDFVIIMDADLSHPVKFIPRFIAKQAEADYDIVTGTRYAGDGGVYGWDLKRKLISRGANLFADTQVISKVEGKGYSFQMEIMILAKKGMGFKVAEVPIEFPDRIEGVSKMGGNEITEYIKGVVSLFFRV